MAYKLDIFALLGDISDPKKQDIYSKLGDDERKGFAPLVVMRWLTGTSDERQIMLINEFVNTSVFALAKHPHLLMLLMEASNTKSRRHYQWLGIKTKKRNVETLRAIGEYYEMSQREVRLMNPLPPPDEVIEMAEACGWQKEEMAKLKKELKDAT